MQKSHLKILFYYQEITKTKKYNFDWLKNSVLSMTVFASSLFIHLKWQIWYVVPDMSKIINF